MATDTPTPTTAPVALSPAVVGGVVDAVADYDRASERIDEGRITDRVLREHPTLTLSPAPKAGTRDLYRALDDTSYMAMFTGKAPATYRPRAGRS